MKDCIEALSKVDEKFTPIAIEHCLELLSTSPLGSGKIGTFALDPTKVCVFRAKQLLKDSENRGQQWEVSEFEKSWKRLVPLGMQPAMDMLRGLALVQTTAVKPSLRLLDRDTLPTDAESRFRQLFSISNQWTREDLQPYLSGILAPGQNEDQLLLQHTRKIQAVQGKPQLYVPLLAPR